MILTHYCPEQRKLPVPLRLVRKFCEICILKKITKITNSGQHVDEIKSTNVHINQHISRHDRLVTPQKTVHDRFTAGNVFDTTV